MSALRFRLPPDLPDNVHRWLTFAYLQRGSECLPVATSVAVEEEQLVLHPCETVASVAACIPWMVGSELWMLATTTLMPRLRPYDLVRELARGQLHQVRELATAWEEAGLISPRELTAHLRQALRQFLYSAQAGQEAHGRSARQALQFAMVAGQALTLETARSLAQARQERSPVPFYVGHVLDRVTHVGDLTPLYPTFQGIRLTCPFDPQACEQESYWWHLHLTLDCLRRQGWQVCLGPFFDFASTHFYELWQSLNNKEQFLQRGILFLSRMCAHAEFVHDWHIASAVNLFPTELGLEEGIRFLGRLLRPIKRLLRGKNVSVGLAHPFGELAARSQEHPIPVLLADWLSRADLGLTALDLELIFECEPRGSFLRPPWSISHLFDVFSDIQLPLHLSLGLPATHESDALADPPDQEVFVPANEDWQAAWASALLDLALAHPNVQRVTWLDASDAIPHLVPHGGLLDKNGRPRPVLQAFRQRCPHFLRQKTD
ncbi:MAG: hypothetical protein RMI91_09105 [Gemmatales bacterium]|nr:hypothetical protein [Gemmatales bacterium]MDW7994797.1 hypothetical protein [Gemmatales bacterium]